MNWSFGLALLSKRCCRGGSEGGRRRCSRWRCTRSRCSPGKPTRLTCMNTLGARATTHVGNLLLFSYRRINDRWSTIKRRLSNILLARLPESVMGIVVLIRCRLALRWLLKWRCGCGRVSARYHRCGSSRQSGSTTSTWLMTPGTPTNDINRRRPDEVSFYRVHEVAEYGKPIVRVLALVL